MMYMMNQDACVLFTPCNTYDIVLQLFNDDLIPDIVLNLNLSI